MTDATAPIVACLLLVAALAVPAAGVAPGDGALAPDADAPGPTAALVASDGSDETARSLLAGDDDTLSPGASLAGALAVHRVHLEGAVDERTFDRRFAAAGERDATGERRARVVVAGATAVDYRLAALAARREALEAAHASGTLGEARYRVELAALAAEADAAGRLAERGAAAAALVPPDPLAAAGADAARLRELAARAETVRGEDADALLRAVVGSAPARPPYPSLDGANLSVGDLAFPDAGGEVPGWTDPTANWTAPDSWNGSDADAPTVDGALLAALDAAAADRASAASVYERVAAEADADDPEVRAALSCAEERLAAARTAVADGRAAAERGDEAALREHVAAARKALVAAADCLEQAQAAASSETPTRS